MYRSVSLHNILVSLNLSLSFINTCCQVQWLVISKDVTKFKVSHWSVDIALAKYISLRFVFYSGRPSTHSQLNASTVQLAVSQHICGAAVMCRPAHGRTFPPFVPSTNNCRSEHMHRMLLSDVAVTTEQHQKENIWI